MRKSAVAAVGISDLRTEIVVYPTLRIAVLDGRIVSTWVLRDRTFDIVENQFYTIVRILMALDRRSLTPFFCRRHSSHPRPGTPGIIKF